MTSKVSNIDVSNIEVSNLADAILACTLAVGLLYVLKGGCQIVPLCQEPLMS